MKWKLTLLTVLFMSWLSCHAQQSTLKQITSYMKGEASLGFNGNVLIARNSKILYQNSFGYRDFTYKKPLDNLSVFELASVSKQFTAMGILILKEQGKLKLTDSLRKYFPQLPYHNITIYNLLTHTSGLPDYQSEMEKKWDHEKIAFNKEIIDFLAKEKPPVNFNPGKYFDYSNTGYVLLACIIEKITGLSYNAFLKQNIFIPLKMFHSRVYNTRRSKNDTIPDYAYGYVLDHTTHKYLLPDSVKDADFVYWLDGVTGDGTVNSTTGDLLKWTNALLNSKLLTSKDQKAMLYPYVLEDTLAKKYYGYGIEIGKDELGHFITHSGSWPGYATQVIHYYSGDYTIIVLSNNHYNAGSVSNALAYILNDKPVITPYQHKKMTIDTTLLDRYVGTYSFPIKIQVIKRNGKLYRHLPGRSNNSDVELIPESTTKFFYNNGIDIQIDFGLNSRNQVEHVYIVNYGVKMNGQKLN